MKKSKLISICSAEPKILCKIVESSSHGITFLVDEGLSAPTKHIKKNKAVKIIESFLRGRDIDSTTADVISSSFSKESLCNIGEDVMYQTILRCFAEHRPLILSPDMIWLVINQSLANHIDSNAEKFRKKIVWHKGKHSLTVESPTEILCQDTDWLSIIEDFHHQISSNTKKWNRFNNVL